MRKENGMDSKSESQQRPKTVRPKTSQVCRSVQNLWGAIQELFQAFFLDGSIMTALLKTLSNIHFLVVNKMNYLWESVTNYLYDWYKFFYVTFCQRKEEIELTPFDAREMIFDAADINHLNAIFQYGKLKEKHYEAKLR